MEDRRDDARLPSTRVQTAVGGPPCAALRKGATVDRYIILSTLGQGAMGRVYRAYDPKLHREVALKRIERRMSDASQWLAEARAMARVRHPNIVPVHDAGEDETGGHHVFIAMELVEGPTLADWLRASHSRREITASFVQVAAGLAAAHEAGLVHRDIKPSNILIDSVYGARITDFGLVATLASENTQDGDLETHLPLMMGTPAYMPPEQLRGEPVDARADQYAFCVSLFEALCGQLPFDGEGLDLLAAKTAGRIPADRWVGLPSRTRRVIERGLAPVPSDRFPSMRHLSDTLVDEAGRKRNRWLMAAAGASILAGAWGLTALRERHARQACLDESRQRARMTEAERDEMREALLGTGASYAASTWARVEPALADYTDRWEQAHARACVAHRVEDRFSKTEYARMQSCLAEHREDLETFAEAVTIDASATLEEAVDTALSLRRPDGCLEEPYLRQSASASPEARDADGTRRAREALHRSAVLGHLQQREDALEAAQIAEEAASDAAWPRGQIRAKRRIAMLSMLLDDLETAQIELHEAYTLALGTGDDESASAVARQLVDVLQKGPRPQQALAWAEISHATLVRSGGLGRIDEAHLLQSWGNALRAVGELKAAASRYARARALFTEQLGPDHPTLVAPIMGMGSVRSFQGRQDEAVALLEQALQVAERAHGDDHPAIAKISNNLGMALIHAGRFKEAFAPLERALVLKESAQGWFRFDTAGTLGNLAIVYASLGDDELGLELLEQQLDVVTTLVEDDDPRLVDVLTNLGTQKVYMGDPESACADLERALAIGRKHELSSSQMATTFLSLAQAYVSMHRTTEGVATAREALSVWTQAYGPEYPELNLVYSVLGQGLLELGEIEAAIVAAEEGLRLLALGPSTDVEKDAELESLLARLLRIAKRDPERVQELAQRAIAHFEEAGRRDVSRDVQAWLDGTAL